MNIAVTADWGGVAVLAVVNIAVLVVAYLLLRPSVAQYSELTGKAEAVAAAPNAAARLWARLDGWKTNILAVIGIVLPQLDQVLGIWQALPWGSVFDQKTASAISLASAALIPITRIWAVAKAGRADPNRMPPPPPGGPHS